MPRRVGFYVKIDSELLKQFKEYVLRKHGSLRGYISIELEAAIKKYMESGGGGGIEDVEERYLGQVRRTVEALSKKSEVKYSEIVGELKKYGVPACDRPRLAEIVMEELRNRSVIIIH